MIGDTPLARLDSDHRNLLIERYFPYASHQVLILSTGTEVDERYFEELRPKLAKVYHLDFKEDFMLPNSTLNRHIEQRGDRTIPLIGRIERIVQVRTGGRVSELFVQVQGGEVILTGRAATFHIKQLATQAVLEELSGETLTNAIEVYC